MANGQNLTIEDVRALEIGAAILGTGGGGNPYLGRLRVEQLLKQGAAISVVPLEDVRDEDVIVSVGGIGAPVIGIEKFEHGDECYRALRAVERVAQVRADALIAGEIGGANSMEPLITAMQAGLPVVDGDGMGRAFPELQMCTFFIYGHPPHPAALADDKGNAVTFSHMRDVFWLERFARANAVDMGAGAGFALPPMSGSWVRQTAVPCTLTQAIALGRAVMEARRTKRTPIEAILSSCNGILLFQGKVIDVNRRLARGFAVGSAIISGVNDDMGATMEIELQNENLIARRDGTVVAVVPDLIAIVDLDTGYPITTEILRYGLRVAVLGLPCHPLLRTPEALAVIGPRAFGLDVPYQPLSMEAV